MDYRLFRTVNDLSGNAFVDAVMKAAATYAIGLSFVVLVVLCLVRARKRRLLPVTLTGAALVLTFLLSLVGAKLYGEQRPFQTHRVHQLLAHAPGQSFPSDHATAAFGIALAVGAFLSWRWGALLFAVALLVGFARVYDGIHYPADIAGGLLAALLGVAVVAGLGRASRPTPWGAGSRRPLPQQRRA